MKPLWSSRVNIQDCLPRSKRPCQERGKRGGVTSVHTTSVMSQITPILTIVYMCTSSSAQALQTDLQQTSGFHWRWIRKSYGFVCRIFGDTIDEGLWATWGSDSRTIIGAVHLASDHQNRNAFVDGEVDIMLYRRFYISIIKICQFSLAGHHESGWCVLARFSPF